MREPAVVSDSRKLVVSVMQATKQMPKQLRPALGGRIEKQVLCVGRLRPLFS